MLSDAARVVVRFGMTFLVLAVLLRMLPMAPASRIGDDLAILVNALVVVVAGAYGRRSAPMAAERSAWRQGRARGGSAGGPGGTSRR